jgi:hypothetical protein
MVSGAGGARICHMTHVVSTPSRDDEAPGLILAPPVTRQLREIFTRLPALAGFHLRSDLTVADVSLVSGAKGASRRRLQVSLMQALVELAECDREAMACLRGRSFARRCH